MKKKQRKTTNDFMLQGSLNERVLTIVVNLPYSEKRPYFSIKVIVGARGRLVRLFRYSLPKRNQPVNQGSVLILMLSFHCRDGAFQLCYFNHFGIFWDDLEESVLVVSTLCWNPLGSRFGAVHCVLEPSIPDILFFVRDDRGDSFSTLHSVLDPSTPGIPFFCLWDDLRE